MLTVFGPRVCRSVILAILPVALLPNSAWAAETSPPLVVADRACLFLDDRFAAERPGFTRRWHAGLPEPEAMIEADRPWEAWPHLFGGVAFDPHEKLYKMWYQVLNPRAPLDAREGSGRYFVCYAESTDGKRWIKPDLGLVSFLGKTDNNIFRPEEAELPNVFLDPQESDPRKRFKMLVWLRPGGHLLFASADGRRWEKLGVGVPPYELTPREERPVRSDTNVVIWDPLGRRYLSAYRTYPKHAFGFHREGYRRGVGFTVSDRLEDGWQPIKTSIRAEDADDARVALLGSSTEKNKNWSEPYIAAPFVYGNHYLALVSMLDYVDGSDFAVGGGSLELAFSHDGFNWKRPAPATPAIRRRPEDELFPCYAAVQPPLVIDDRLRHYYSEANGAHPVPSTAKSRIRAATWRIDGFASLAAADGREAKLTTPLLIVGGSRLRINVACPHGRVRWELRDADGNPIPGFTLDDSDAFSGDSVRHVLSWRGRSDLTSIVGTAVRLHVALEEGDLYAFQFAEP
jgi:hypothetical protein